MRIDEGFCPTLRPTRAAFEKPFCDYVREVFAKNPDLPCFKVIPPKGWAPRKAPLDLERIRINTPIKQHVFGKSGAYVCILEEQRGMTAADFKRLAARKEHQAPAKGGCLLLVLGHRDDHLSERAFWSGVTNSPPLYGADTPISLFDSRVAWGWNLRHLGCMLQDGEYEVPDIPGVTSPMTYFGMWKSFFGWHKEDIDLYSVNYLHFGAPKVWYCVSPRDNPKFDAMAQALYPDLHRACHGFMRHKDILISPRMLRSYNVPYIQAKQEAGEFIVLNAAAYHAGFNLGFNCAGGCGARGCAVEPQAVNFAMEDWVEAGKAAVPCTCSALPQGVQLDMGIFCPELREESSDEEEDSSDEESGSEEDEAESGSDDERPAAKRRRGAAGAVKPVRTPKLPEVCKMARADDVPRDATHAQWGKVAEERPLAIVERDERSRQLRFSLVHRLAKASNKPGAMWVGLLKEGPDGLFRPQSSAKLLKLGMHFPRVVRVRAEWVVPEDKRRGGWALKTKQAGLDWTWHERILM
ncbi:hypothetical protein CHLNCDRAFT_137990 [Chlorella variabilis]|uniref:JmjC domain-containing protein n=1 Tax=Chlorella variabilis TaxID=554065 RepID=E1Z505_CHLVA|nr:hypothetical protein CHLNCDRAFT_137990 [Chlorella variabilis]EFN59438.1 hypothetical protein CHLNCDRAFT_137990 [Chlorella variabilis]|eukprot:XP_005851540.1 hypothetical protein CHLNCDRAFT_137990 [Chlorella variabilis]